MRGGACRALLCSLVLAGCPGTAPGIRPHDGPAPLTWPESGGPADVPVTPGAERGVPVSDRARGAEPAALKPDRPPPQPDRPPPQPDLPCPGGCDDGDPCTVDSCGSKGCVHQPAGQVIVRYYNPSTGAHGYSPGAGPPGFGNEGPVFRTLTAAASGTTALYEQTNGKDFMLSTSATEGVACCGYYNWGQLGWGFSGNAKGTIPLYRLNNPSGLHLSSTSATEGTSVGYALEGVTLYVCPL